MRLSDFARLFGFVCRRCVAWEFPDAFLGLTFSTPFQAGALHVLAQFCYQR